MDTAKEFLELKEEIDELRQILIELLEAPLMSSGPKLGTGRAHFHNCSPSRMKAMMEIKDRLQNSSRRPT